MSLAMREMQEALHQALHDLHKEAHFSESTLLVVGCSTSEVAGQHIGTAGTTDIAKQIFTAIKSFQSETNVQLAFQCCEHLNRALVVERETARQLSLEQVAVIPVPRAGGSMASYAYNHLQEPVIVEHIKADAGIDIGDTFIGMHLKHVAVPVRSAVKEIGNAHLTMAMTRPKLIGGSRAVYELTNENEACH